MDTTGVSQLEAQSKDSTSLHSVVTVDHLGKNYGDLKAVDDVTFAVKEGEIFGVIGPNGAGKTTVVECISGLRNPDSGSISVLGVSPQTERDKIREFVGVQLQESALPPRLMVIEALELFASFYQNPLDLEELVESLGITGVETSRYGNLSGGQKQRLSIALALVGNPKITVLDELTTGLDPEARRETWALIESIRERGVTIILVTHFMDEAERLCDRLALIDHGKLAVLDTPEAIAAKAGGSKVRFVPSAPVDDRLLHAIPGVNQIERKEKYISVTGIGDLAASVIYFLEKRGVFVSDIEARTGSLEDAFVKLTREGRHEGRGGTRQ